MNCGIRRLRRCNDRQAVPARQWREASSLLLIALSINIACGCSEVDGRTEIARGVLVYAARLSRMSSDASDGDIARRVSDETGVLALLSQPMAGNCI